MKQLLSAAVIAGKTTEFMFLLFPSAHIITMFFQLDIPMDDSKEKARIHTCPRTRISSIPLSD